jgi:hypothetical protein
VGSRVARPPSASVYRRRRLAAVAALAVVLAAAVVVLLGAGGDDPARTAGSGGGDAQPAAKQAPPPPELPRGGREVLPKYRVVAYYGAPQADELGILGIGTPTRAGRRLVRQAKPYERKTRPVLPAMELIAVIANAHPGEGGRYNSRQPDATIERYLKAARKIKALLVLDIQPGRSDFFTETTRLRKWLEQPDVGLAIDPEWRMAPGQVPGQVIGQVGSREVNATSAWLAQLVKRHNLPQKLFVIHQFTDDMVPERALKPRPELAMVLNADGFGTQLLKRQKYHAFTRNDPKAFHQGFKLFYREDTDLMTPRQTLALRPPPDLVVYE